MDTTVLLVLANGTHRIITWLQPMTFADVQASVRARDFLVSVASLTLAIGDNVTNYTAGEVAELFT